MPKKVIGFLPITLPLAEPILCLAAVTVATTLLTLNGSAVPRRVCDSKPVQRKEPYNRTTNMTCLLTCTHWRSNFNAIMATILSTTQLKRQQTTGSHEISSPYSRPLRLVLYPSGVQGASKSSTPHRKNIPGMEVCIRGIRFKPSLLAGEPSCNLRMSRGSRAPIFRRRSVPCSESNCVMRRGSPDSL